MDRPSCQRHPDAHVTNARVPGRARCWVCLVCAADLGPAPELDTEISETVRIEADDVGTLKPSRPVKPAS